MTYQPALSTQTHRNHYLFSDYYLNERIQDRAEWSEDTTAIFERIRDLWRGFTPGGNEAQTEQDWIQPVLDALGHRFNVQVSIRTPLGSHRPDYIFYPDEASRQAQIGQGTLTEADLGGALAVGDAKAWDRPLDQPIRTASEPGQARTKTSENPSYQIDFYLRHTGREWGILTNGRLWRLYHRETSKKLDVFYEVDLPALLEQGDRAAFNYFYLFFRRGAFVGETPWLQTVLHESDRYEQGVSASLKEQVYEALRELSQGFLDFPQNNLNPTPQNLKEIYDHSLIVLYRLLFIFYAEDRGLLPVQGNSAYRQQYSLYAIKQSVRRQIDAGEGAVTSMSGLWSQLRDLWRAIDQGNDHLDVPQYNGGLFDPQKHPFLERYRVGDLHLRRAIDLLARAEDPNTRRREFVDYRDLEIRHLGSIYEGLLEYQLRVAQTDLITVRQNKREVYEPMEASSGGQAPLPAIRAGQAYLVTDKGERKATGSYYTPDYIVQYIVEQTVGPVLETIRERYAGEDGTIDDEAGLVADLLAVNVLDPAMGSGHFLVAATDFMARYLVGLGLDAATGLDGEAELTYWRRRVVQGCIYGVDVNRLAVELAKLSLWLNTVARDKPLSFLDHHLRHGNSLIGARVADLHLGGPATQKSKRAKSQRQEAAGQMALLDDSAFVGGLRTATRYMSDIEALQSETLADVKEAERIYQQTRESVTRQLRRVANVWTARHFGLSIDDETLKGLSNHLLHRSGFPFPAYEAITAQAEAIAQERSFFHWELEFPEVFFDREGQIQEETAGFDAVIGNPPYIDIKGLAKELSDFLSTNFFTLRMRINIFAAFLEQAINLTSGNGNVGLIIPAAFLTQVSYSTLRKLILEQHQLSSLIRLPNESFGNSTGDVKVDTCIVVVGLDGQTEGQKTTILIYDSFERIDEISEKTASKKFQVAQTSWVNDSDSVITLAALDKLVIPERMRLNSVVLENLCEFCLGLTPYDKYAGHTKEQIDTKAFHSNFPLDPTYKRLLVSGDVKRYFVEWNGEEWIKYGPWLAAPREHRFFKEERILVQQIIDWSSLRIFASWTDDELYNTQNQFNLLPRGDTNLKFILALLNSSLMCFYHRQMFLDVGLQRFQKILIRDAKTFPIPNIQFSTPADERARLAEKGRRLYGQFCAKGDDACVLGFVDHQLSPDPAHHTARTDVIHDLLAFLAEQMIERNKARQKLEQALDPFKYLDRGAACLNLPQIFAEAIKYGQLLAPDLGQVRHDIDGLRLLPAGDGWLLEAELKLRDPESGWQRWQYEADSRTIARNWTPIYRLPLPLAQGRYYQQALPVLSQFANAGAIPGGRTRSTLQKLQAIRVPVFPPDLDLTPLLELQAELADVRQQIERTDRLIDQIVYRLYGLTAEEIQIVEEGSPQA